MNKKMFNEMEELMGKALDVLKSDFATIRAGRASTALLDKIFVDYYGTSTPINQVGSVSVPEPKMILIQPWDTNMLGVIEKAILKSDLRLTPNNDGKVIRLILPDLTSERRQQLAKMARTKAEDAKITIRNIRREYNDAFRKIEKAGEISEDDLKRSQDDIQKITDKYIDETDKALAAKEKDIMEV